MNLPYADDLNYWKTSKASSEHWIQRTIKQIEKLEGSIIGHAFAQMGENAAFTIEFKIQGNSFKLIWPVLPTRNGSETAAKIQAATMLYHDTKAKCLKSLIFGPRTAFFEYLLLPDGRQMSQASDSEFNDILPEIFKQLK